MRNLSRENFGFKKNRPELDKMIEHYREDDILYVWWLERSGRSHIIDLVLSLNEKVSLLKA